MNVSVEKTTLEFVYLPIKKMLYMKNSYFVFSVFFAVFASGIAQSTFGPRVVSQGRYLGVSPALSSLENYSPPENVLESIVEVPNNLRNAPKSNANALPQGADPLLNSSIASRTPSEVLQSFNGISISEGGGFRPPDPTGAVGPNHYVHAVNTALKVFDKQGNTILGPVRLGVFFGNGNNDGDPIVLYDQLADRWFVSEFINGSTEGLLIGVSTSPDPTSTYNIYEFALDDFPDYPHYTVWPDGYYLTANKFTGNTTYVLYREALIAGEANPTIIGFDLPGVIRNPNTVFSPEPANLQGTSFPANVPGYIVYLQDDAWGGVSFDHLKVWSIDVNFDSPGNSSISDPQIIATQPFDSTFSPFGEGDAFQPGVGAKIDNIGGVISYMANYRSFPTHNSFLINFNADIDGFDTSGIRWIELRNQGTGDFEIYQEGTHSVADGDSRFLGSMSMDNEGNIALAYNVSGFGSFPGIRYTGRLANDPLGRMTFEEAIIQDGIGVQDPSNRFGDYSQMTLDPDGETFWHVAEYFSADNIWNTRIAAFNLENLILNTDNNAVAEAIAKIYPINENLYEVSFTTALEYNKTRYDLISIKGAIVSSGVFERDGVAYKSLITTTTLASGVYVVNIYNGKNYITSKRFLLK